MSGSKKFVVTGGYGMLGSNLVTRLAKMGHEVVVIDNDIRGMEAYARSMWSELHVGNQITVVEQDIREAVGSDAAIALAKGASGFVHLADIVAGIGYVFGNQYDILHQNISIDKAALEFAMSAGLSRLIYASTACAFNQERQRTIDSKISIANDLYPAFPESTYGWAKAIGDISLENLTSDRELQKTTIFFHNLLGTPCDYWSAKAQVVPAISKRAVDSSGDESPSLVVWGSGQQGRAFVPVQKAVDAIIHAINEPQRYYHVGPEFCTTILEASQEIVALLGDRHTIEFDRTKPEGDLGRAVDPSEDCKVPGVQISKKDIALEIRKTVEWVQQDLLS